MRRAVYRYVCKHCGLDKSCVTESPESIARKFTEKQQAERAKQDMKKLGCTHYTTTIRYNKQAI